MYATAINWATMTFPLLMLLTFGLYLQMIFIDGLFDELGPVHFHCSITFSTLGTVNLKFEC